MGNGYTVPPSDVLDELRQILTDARARLRELEALDGTQIYDTVQNLKKLIDGVLEQTDVNVSGSVTAGGNVTAGGTITANTAFNSLATYSRNVTGSGSYRSLWVNIDGEIGYVPSSLQFKRDIADIDPDPAVLDVQVVRFRYKDAVENMGEDAPVEVGVIAEQVHALGLSWLVDYDANGEPFGVKYDRLALALLPMVQDLSSRITAAGL